MSHTFEPWSFKSRISRVYGLIDLGELAVRLGGPSVYDRRGNVIFYDTFESPNALKWSMVAGGAGTIAISNDRAWQGDYSLKCVTEASEGFSTDIYKRLAFPFERRIGLELMFCPTANRPVITMGLQAYSGSVYNNGFLEYDYHNKTLKYSDSDGNFQSLTVYDTLTMNYEHWAYIKLVIDLNLGEYVRAIFGGTTYDLSGIALRSVASALPQFLLVQYWQTALNDAAATTYFDNIIVTQNEP